MRLPPGGAVSGWAALRLCGGGFFDGTRSGRSELPVDLVVPPNADIRRAASIRKHRGALDPDHVHLRHGIPCTIPARALFDAIRWEPSHVRRQQIADLAVSAALTTTAETHACRSAITDRRGRSIVERTLIRASNRVMSPQETTLRLLWEDEASLPPVRCNWPVADEAGRYLGRPDLLCDVEAVAVEYDGHDHTRDDVRAVDLTKEDAYRRCGLEYIRVIRRDLTHPDRILARMRQAVARSRASSLPRTFQVARNPRPVISERDAVTGFAGQYRS